MSEPNHTPPRNTPQAGQNPLACPAAPAAASQPASSNHVPEDHVPVPTLNQQTAAFGSAIQQIAWLQSLLSGNPSGSQAPPDSGASASLPSNGTTSAPNAGSQEGNTGIRTQASLVAKPAQLSPSQPPPGVVMVPCRARGMPQDHNSKVI